MFRKTLSKSKLISIITDALMLSDLDAWDDDDAMTIRDWARSLNPGDKFVYGTNYEWYPEHCGCPAYQAVGGDRTRAAVNSKSELELWSFISTFDTIMHHRFDVSKAIVRVTEG